MARAGMMSFVGKRIAQSILVMLVVALLAFALFRFVGDPVASMVGQDTTSADRALLREQLGLNDPIILQFARFVGSAVQGDFGVSYRHRIPVMELIAERLPATLELSFVSALFAIVLGLPLGVYTAINRKGWVSQFFMSVSLIGVSLPTFLIGLLLILWFAVILRWLPAFGRGDVVLIGWWATGFLTPSGLLALILPALTLALFQMTLIMRLVRAEMLEVLRADFIKFGKARGLPKKSLYYRHALKNTLMPVVTITGLQLGSIIAFSIITESVFQWPGVGLMFVQAIGDADIPVMATYLILIAFIFVVINLLVDLLYLRIDPRLRVSTSQ